MQTCIYAHTHIHTRTDTPCALACFYFDVAKNATPAIAVASGPHIYIYRSLRVFFKFTLPPVELDVAEVNLMCDSK